MQVIPPLEITDSILTSSTVPEEVAATYAGGTTYAEGDLAGAAPVYGSPQTVWRSLQNGNTGNAQVEGAWWTEAGIVYPEYSSGHNYSIGEIVTVLATHSLYEALAAHTNSPVTDTTKWLFVGRTNRWKMFNYTRNLKTSVPSSLTVVLTPGKRINSIGLKGIVANSYTLTATSVLGGGTVYSASGSLNTRVTVTWSEYFFGEFSTQPSLNFFDIPFFSDIIITLTLTSTSGNASIGAMVIGTFVYLGETQSSASSDILNFSTVDRDIDGNAILVQRRNIPKTRQRVLTAKSNVDKAISLRETLNATPALWYGLDDETNGYFEASSILGFYRGFEIDMSMPDHAVLLIELEEV
jgi:hypothetical protein